MTLSIIIPCFNERATLEKLVTLVEKSPIGNISKEIIIIDDYSTDGSKEILTIWQKTKPYKIIFHTHNQGKGSAIRTGLTEATGDIVLIQDADLEYDPNDYQKLIDPIIKKEARVVYGSRFFYDHTSRSRTSLFQMGTELITATTNALYGSHLTDEPTCYKVFDRNLIIQIPLTCTRFEFCPEVTAKILRKGIPITEVPISYTPRNIAAGKKIKWHDGVVALWTLFRYRFFT